MAKYLSQVAGVLTEVAGASTSAGATDAGKIPQLDGTGKLDASMMPTGIGADTFVISASENLAAGDFVNVWNSTGTFKARKADATVPGKSAMGFVLTAVTSGNNATVYFEGSNTQLSGQTPGVVYLSTTAGTGTPTPPSASGNIVQSIGFATSATSVNVQVGQPITLA